MGQAKADCVGRSWAKEKLLCGNVDHFASFRGNIVKRQSQLADLDTLLLCYNMMRVQVCQFLHYYAWHSNGIVIFYLQSNLKPALLAAFFLCMYLFMHLFNFFALTRINLYFMKTMTLFYM